MKGKIKWRPSHISGGEELDGTSDETPVGHLGAEGNLRTCQVMRKGKRDGRLRAVERRKTKGVVERALMMKKAEEDRSARRSSLNDS